jgi:PBP1b-binding outer membrane lipoprotein LpoB
MYKNKLKNKTTVWIKIFLLTVMLFLPGCRKNIAVKENVLPASGIEKILIFPFKNMSAVYGENVNCRCPICGKVFMTGKVAEDADNMLTEQLFILLKDRKDIELIPAGQSQGVVSDLLSEDKKRLSEQNLLIETGRTLNADLVLSGYIFCFRERVGGKYSVDLPASVTFDIHLIRVADGRLLWSDHFDETQRPLSENLFQLGSFLHRKAKWITANEMAVSGLKNILKTFPILNKPEPKVTSQ